MSLTYYDLNENELLDFSKLFNGTKFDVIVAPHQMIKYIDRKDLGNKMIISIKNGRPKQINQQMYQTNIYDLILELKYILKQKLHILLFDYLQEYRNIFMSRADIIWTDVKLNSDKYKLVQNHATVVGKQKFYRSFYTPKISKMFFRPPI